MSGALGSHQVRFIANAQHDLMLGSVSIIVSTRNRHGSPHLMRAVGCRISDRGDHVALLMAASTCTDLLADVRDNGRVAVVFSEPSTHLSLQLKGRDAHVLPVRPGDAEIAADYVSRMVTEIALVGFDEALVRSMLGYTDDDLIIIGFSPCEAYEQTPGPLAGQSLNAAAS